MLLVLDTSGPSLGVGLFDPQGVPVGERRQIVGRGHAETLLPAIRTLMDETGSKPADLSRIAVVAGPGSFMGLRVGLAASRAMALALGIEAVGVSRTRALARGHGAIEIVLDARRGAVFREAFSEAGEPIADPSGRSLEALPVGEYRSNAVRWGGSGARLAGMDEKHIAFDDDTPTLRHVAALARIAPLPPVPVYGRGADAKPQQAPIIGAATGC